MTHEEIMNDITKAIAEMSDEEIIAEFAKRGCDVVIDHDEDYLDEDHPLWCVNEQIKELLIGYGASEDHEMVIQFFRETGLPEGTVARIHRALICAEHSPIN